MAGGFVGVDPGKAGHLCRLPEDGGPPEFWALPTVPAGKGRAYDLRGVYRLVLDICALARFSLLEQQQAMRGQGVTSTFSTGYGFGLLEMALTASSGPFDTIRPAEWKKRLGLTGPKGEPKKAKKARAVAKAQRLYPAAELVPPGCRVPSHDRAEALLLAHYAKALATGAPL